MASLSGAVTNCVHLSIEIPCRHHDQNLLHLQLLHKGHRVVAAARSPSKSSGLDSLASKYGSALTLVTLDVSDPSSIKVTGDHNLSK